MGAYLIRRLLGTLVTLVGVSVLIFVLLRVVPGDIARERFGDSAPEDVIRAFRAKYALDRPIYLQYLLWSRDIFSGNLGISLWTEQPVAQEFMSAWPITFELAMMAGIIGTALGIILGVISAVRRSKLDDYILRLFAIGGLAVPHFLLGTLVLLVLSLWLAWIPPIEFHPLVEDPIQNLLQMFLPSGILGLGGTAFIMRMTRSSMLEVLRQDYIRTAWAKGLGRLTVLNRHALRNAAIPIVTLVGYQFALLLGGTVIIEVIFGLPGLGRQTLDGIIHRDYPQVQFNIFVFAVTASLANLLVDLSYGLLDPRIRY